MVGQCFSKFNVNENLLNCRLSFNRAEMETRNLGFLTNDALIALSSKS
jgi:hypothetical protein